MQIQQIRNATMVLSYGGKRFLIDPMFAPKNSYAPIEIGPNPDLNWPTCDLPMEPAEIIKGLDVIIMTHYHNDHFDQAAADTLRKGVKVYVQDEIDKEVLQKLGFSNLTILQEDGMSFAGIWLYKTRCQHGIRSKAEPIFNSFGMRYNSMGVVFKHTDEKTVYITGDTIWCDEVKKVIDMHQPDYVIVNCADAQMKGCGSIIMNAQDVKELHTYAPDVTIIASHMDTVGHAALTRKQLQKFAKDNKFANSIIIPKDGEILKL